MATDVRYRFLATDEVSKTVKGISGALGDLGSQIGGPVGEALDKLSGGLDKVKGHGPATIKVLGGIGAAALGLGAIMVKEADKEKAATAQLQAAVQAAGQDWEPYRKRVEVAAKANEHYGYTSQETSLALAKITLATKNPQAAIDNLGLAVNIAAAKHIGLGDAAGIVAKILNGNTKVLKSYGINLASVKEATGALDKAERSRRSALVDVDRASSRYAASLLKVKDAQQNLADKQALARANGKISLSESIQLRKATEAVARAQAVSARAHEALTAAQGKSAAAAKRVTNAQQAVTAAQKGVASATTQVSQRVQGQANAMANTWAGRWRHMKAVTEDWIAHTGADWGGKILAFGGVLSSFAALFDTGLVKAIGRSIAATYSFLAVNARVTLAIVADGAKRAAVWTLETAKILAQRGAMIAVSVATKAWAAAQWLLNAAMEANPIGLVVAAVVALGVGLYEAYKHSETFRNIVNGAFHAVAAAGKWMWESVLRPTFKFLADAWFTVAGVIVHGAAEAFGWVPGLGGKLKSAARAFDTLRHDVDRSLSGIGVSGEAAGRNLVAGVKVGIDRNAGKVYQRAQALGRDTARMVNKGMQVASPSKITTYGGQMIAEGLIVGMKSRHAAVNEAARALTRNLKYEMQRGLEQATAALSKTKARLAEVVDFRHGVTNSARQFGDIGGLSLDGGSLRTQLAGKLAAIQAFGRNLDTLRKKHFDRSILAQIINAGVERGGPLAAALVNESAADFNKLSGQIANASAALGAAAGLAVNGDAERILTARARSEGAAVQSIKYEIHVHGPADTAGAAREIQKILLQLKRTSGTSLGLA